MSSGEDFNKSGQSETQNKYVKPYGAQGDKNEDYGFYFFPGREKGKVAPDNTAWFGNWKEVFFKFRKDKTVRCMYNKQRCIQTNPKVKLLLRALEAHGCPVDIKKHIICERCHWKAAGGFDHFANQLVLCENNVSQRSMDVCCHVMAHELLHAFDKCRAKFDIKNLEHMACTEIRASNLLGCTRSSSYRHRDGASVLNVDNSQKTCVKREALLSVMMGRNIEEHEGRAVLDKVFDRCYNDTEPFGRRMRTHLDEELALKEGLVYGYTPCNVEKESQKPENMNL